MSNDPYRNPPPADEHETCTTVGRAHQNPVRPKGNGWRLISCIPEFNPNGYSTGGAYWYWERLVPATV